MVAIATNISIFRGARLYPLNESSSSCELLWSFKIEEISDLRTYGSSERLFDISKTFQNGFGWVFHHGPGSEPHCWSSTVGVSLCGGATATSQYPRMTFDLHRATEENRERRLSWLAHAYRILNSYGLMRIGYFATAWVSGEILSAMGAAIIFSIRHSSHSTLDKLGDGDGKAIARARLRYQTSIVQLSSDIEE